MKSVLNIAKAELRYMATSPIAWGSSFVLLILFASGYITVLSDYVSGIETGGRVDGLTYVITVYCPYAAWMKKPILMMGKFVLPFLFMSVISREFSSGTMRLIQSSPISVGAFVWGKFLGLMVYIVGLVAVYAMLVVVFALTVVAPEVSLLAWQLVVVALYYFLIAAICLFASSLSSHTLVGGVVAILLVLGTNLLNNIGQATAMGDFFYPLSHQAMAERLITGGIDWNDVLMLLILTLLFVQLTIVHLQNKSRNLAEAKRALRFCLPILTAFVFFGLLPYTPLGFTDIRRDDRESVHPKMQAMLKEMDEGPLDVTLYFNIIFSPDMRTGFYIPEGQPGTKFNAWRPYMRHKKDIRVNVKYYYALDSADYYSQQLIKAYQGKSEQEIARIMADTYGFPKDNLMSLEEAQREVDIKGNEYIRHIIKMTYKDRETEILVPGYDLPDDRHYYTALERLMNDRGKELFFVRDGKPLEVFYKTWQSGFLTDKQASLTMGNWQQLGPLQDSIRLDREDLPEEASVLVLLGPREPLSDTALHRIKQFIDRGGNLLLAGEPMYREHIKPIMDYLGVSMMPGVIVQPTPDIGSSRLYGAFDPNSYSWFQGMTASLLESNYFGHHHTDTMNLIFDGASGLDVSRVSVFEVTPVVYSRGGRSWNKTIVSNYDSLQLMVKKKPTDQEGSFPLMVLLHREVNGISQRILVSGDADFMKAFNAFNSANKEYGNGSFFIRNDILPLLTHGDYPVVLDRGFLPDKAFRINMKGVEKQEILLVYVLPALLVIGGSYTILRRRRK